MCYYFDLKHGQMQKFHERVPIKNIDVIELEYTFSWNKKNS